MVLPSSLLDEEDADYPVTNPWLGLPAPPYIVVARVTTVIYKQMTLTTVQIGQGDDGCHP
jgi:hypothetical protein